MLKILVWQVSNDTSFKDKAIKILEQQHNGIEIVGEAVNENIAKVDGGGQYDVLLVVGAKTSFGNRISEARQNTKQFNLPEEKILGDWIVCIPCFTLDKYRQLQRSHLSIFSRNCFGGCVSNNLNLPFRSPFVNLFLSDTDFIKFLRDPHSYIAEVPHFDKLNYSWSGAPNGYPILSLGNISLNMMHYKEVGIAIDSWNKRKLRINWFNLLIVMFTENETILKEFNELPYGKKICFVPFKSDLDSAWYINRQIDSKSKSFVNVIDNFGWGKFYYYDLFDMLLYGKKTPLIDMDYNETYLIPNPFY